MAVIEAQTREELALSVGYNLGAVRVGTLTDNGSVSTFDDDSLPNARSTFNGAHFRATSGDNDGEIRTVDSFDGSTTIGTLRGDDLPTATADGDRYELWDSDIPPSRVYDAINRAIGAVTRTSAVPLTDESLYASLQIQSYTVPTAMTGVQVVQYRDGFDFEQLHQCDAVWRTINSNVTATADFEQHREGSASNKFEVAAGLSAGDIIAQEVIDQVDLSGMTHVEFWIWRDGTTDAGQLKLHLSSGTIAANGAGAEESLDVPAIAAARTWQRMRVALANPEDDTAIDNIGLEDDADLGATTIYIDGIIATRTDEENWRTLHKNFWFKDADQRKIKFNRTAKNKVRHAWLKLRGYKKPTQLDADATLCDVEPEYIINFATAIIVLATSDRHDAAAVDAAASRAREFRILARDALIGSTTPSDVVWFDN